jgi:hypothetical protein
MIRERYLNQTVLLVKNVKNKTISSRKTLEIKKKKAQSEEKK